jgi:putative holliday junction resolvase
MRAMGLDIGHKRIGVAVSDKTKSIAQNLMTLNRRDIKSDLRTLKGIIEEREVDLIVIGLPLNMNGTIGSKAEDILKLKNRLEEELKIKVETYDERLTSKEAEDILIEGDVSRKKRKEKIDKIAACLILQNYLDLKNKS